jgi:hypothetical protein
MQLYFWSTLLISFKPLAIFNMSNYPNSIRRWRLKPNITSQHRTSAEVTSTQFTATQLIPIKSSPATRHEGAWGERRYSSYSFTTSALDAGEWSASRPGRAFTPGERTPDAHCTGNWVGPRAGLDTEDRGKILSPPGDGTSIARSSSP